MARHHKRRRGSAISETGPALLLLFVCVFFPLMDILYLLAGYGFSYFLHNTEARECSVRKPDPAQAAAYLQAADDDFFNAAGGMAAFLGFNASNRNTLITHVGPTYTAGVNGQPGKMVLTTNVQIKPWLFIPLLADVPGLGKNLPISFTTEKPQEESGSDGTLQ